MLERIGDSLVSNGILSIDLCRDFQINLMILELVLEYLLFELLDFDMDALNVYDHVFSISEFMSMSRVHDIGFRTFEYARKDW